MADNDVPRVPLDDPIRNGFNLQQFWLPLRDSRDGPITDYTRGREGKTLTLKQDFYRQLAIDRKQKRTAQTQGDVNERPTDPE